MFVDCRWRQKENKIKFKERQYGKVSVTKRLDQGLLHPKLEVPAGLTHPGRESNPGLDGGRRAFKKRAILFIRNIYICARDSVKIGDVHPLKRYKH
jgi:hypothetical protein